MAPGQTTPPSKTTRKSTRRKKSDSVDAPSQPSQFPPLSPLSDPDPESKSLIKRRIDATSQTDVIDEPVAKRAKTVSTASIHPVFWNLDGNIIVEIEQTRFKLHRSWLVKHSTFFRNVFDDTYNGDRARLEHVNGNTVCYISGVAAEDFAELLAALDRAM
jgi:hypothetical protein